MPRGGGGFWLNRNHRPGRSAITELTNSSRWPQPVRSSATNSGSATRAVARPPAPTRQLGEVAVQASPQIPAPQFVGPRAAAGGRPRPPGRSPCRLPSGRGEGGNPGIVNWRAGPGDARRRPPELRGGEALLHQLPGAQERGENGVRTSRPATRREQRGKDRPAGLFPARCGRSAGGRCRRPARAAQRRGAAGAPGTAGRAPPPVRLRTLRTSLGAPGEPLRGERFATADQDHVARHVRPRHADRSRHGRGCR